VTGPASVSREDVLAILAESGNRPLDVVTEQIDSLGVAWLVHEAERRFGAPLQITDDLLEEMTTVTGAVRVLRAARDKAAAHQ
jgi:acyl carrier protein